MADSRTLSYTAEQIDAILAAAQMHSNRNLLDNWDFRNPVNQRGASGTISEAGYFIDRWKLIIGTATITANGLTLNGTIRQIRETAVGATTTASVEMYSGAATITYNDATKYCDITSSGGTIARCKLEVGTVSTLPNDPPADFGEQLRRCQRYFYAFDFEDWPGVGTYWGRGTSSTEIELYNLIFPVTMRVNPAVNLLRVYDVGSGAISDVSSDGFHRKREGFRAIGVISGMTVEVGKAYVIVKAQFSADL